MNLAIHKEKLHKSINSPRSDLRTANIQALDNKSQISFTNHDYLTLQSPTIIYRQSMFDCPCDGGCPRCIGNINSSSISNSCSSTNKPKSIQKKLKVSQPGDIYEQEADRVAEQVIRMQQSSVLESRSSDVVNGELIASNTYGNFKDAENKEGKLMTDRKKLESDSLFGVSDDVAQGANSVLGQVGCPLDLITRKFMESRFKYDFSEVRIHSDEKAARSAEALNALAYTVGNDIVFGKGLYSPQFLYGKKLLAHELTHVVQQSGSRDKNKASLNLDSVILQKQQAVPEAERIAHLNSAYESALTKRLSDVIDQIQQIPVSFTTDAKAQMIADALQGIDLTDAYNLDTIISTITNRFGSESGAILTSFLAVTDLGLPPRDFPRQPAGPTAEQQERMERQIGLLQIQPRGPYKQYGVGIVLPVVSQSVRGLLPLSEALGNAFRGAGSFVEGMVMGLSGSLGEDQLRRLSERLLESSILNIAFPPVFLSGALVGIVEDVVDAVKGIYHVITNLREVVNGIIELMRAMFSPDSREVAYELGREIGQDYGNRIAVLVQGNIFEFTFGLGRLIGPTIVYTILALLGVPEMIVSAIVARLLPIIRPFLERFPRLLRLIESVSARLIRQRTFTSVESLETELEGSFAMTFDQPALVSLPGGPTIQAPELARGFLGQHLAGFRRLLGKEMTHSDVADLARIWNDAAIPGQSASLKLENSRQLFENQKPRFWRRVREDSAALKLFEDAGLVFEGDVSGPFYRLPDGSIIRMTIDHIEERQTDFLRSLDPSNLQIVFTRENVVMLRQLHAQDPFLH